MECNREEASMVKMMAEKKFVERDVAGAKKLALKAQSLFPDLDGLSQFLATLDVYIASEQRINGEINWYRVLGVEPFAADDIIRRHYRKLALILHPDKNKSVGAEGAFKILSEAWGLLCDKPQRSAYDQKRSLYHMYQNVPNNGSSIATGQNGKDHKSNLTTQKRAKHPNPAPTPRFSADTFWTLCNLCKTQFEYRRYYVNSNLVCQNCRQPFFAVEVPPPPTWTSSVQGKNSTQNVRSDSYAVGKSISNSNMRPEANLSGFCKTDTAGRVSVEAPKSDARKEFLRRIIHGVNEPGAGSATGPSPANFVSAPAGDRLKKKRRTSEHRRNNPPVQTPCRNGGVSDSSAQKGNFETGKRNPFGKFNQTRELSQQELRNLLIDKAKKDIQLQLNGCRIPTVGSRTSEKEMGKGKQKIADTSSGAQLELSVAKLDDDPDRKGPDPVSMSVPDPDFHDFDEDRTEMSFGANQVWAAYDNDDGMPRFYAMIHCVISMKPLRMRISWLNTKNNRELSPLNWIGSGFFKTSGIFWIGKHEVNRSLNSFSHKVKWAKDKRGFVTIYPRKGDVWAMYSHWSPDWNAETPDELIHKYSMVEILEDYTEEEGVSVAPLIKVAGFKTVFCRHPDSSTTKAIPKAELFRLSHQVPSHVLTGNEGRDVPKGCLELDPASMSLELLQVFSEVQVKEMVESAAKANILPVNGENSELQSMEDGETANAKDGVDAAKKTEAETEKLIVYKRKRGQN
ncbi:DNAJ heat shock N-terminal domain-containing protein [Euphorbia peplus]|nr:DNAJ heat shock N-terminal domain-containing protein [Euphorbia peplus]